MYVDFLLAGHAVIDNTTQCNNVKRFSVKVTTRTLYHRVQIKENAQF